MKVSTHGSLWGCNSLHKGSLVAQGQKKPACQCRRSGFDPQVRKSSWRRKWQLTPVFLPGKSHEQRRLAGCNPWGSKRVRHNLVTKQQQQFTSQHLGSSLNFQRLEPLTWRSWFSGPAGDMGIWVLKSLPVRSVSSLTWFRIAGS